ncbi:endonuclease domain-containing protein [Azospirillum aestuarii]|uniref:endonuclease domain-containing protein n=1 Tax=Azospirillum aestuarii TaxID=2802052 RepID=UPI004054AD00
MTMTKDAFERPFRHLNDHDATHAKTIEHGNGYGSAELRELCADQRVFDFADERIADYHRFMRFYEMEVLLEAMKKCESPIEQKMLIALRFIEAPLFFSSTYDMRPLPVGRVVFSEAAFLKRNAIEACEIYPQASVGQYRVDFLIVCKFECSVQAHYIVVECDGHDFHDRTKEQAARDKKRDRDLASVGCHVLRFTGSEIVRDAKGCATQVAQFLHELESRFRKAASGE